MKQVPDAADQLDISVPRHNEKKSRIATMTIRHASFDFPAPINRAKSFQDKSVSLNVISANEDNPNLDLTKLSVISVDILTVG